VQSLNSDDRQSLSAPIGYGSDAKTELATVTSSPDDMGRPALNSSLSILKRILIDAARIIAQAAACSSS
jgi:hypothetical protein